MVFAETGICGEPIPTMVGSGGHDVTSPCVAVTAWDAEIWGMAHCPGSWSPSPPTSLFTGTMFPQLSESNQPVCGATLDSAWYVAIKKSMVPGFATRLPC
jgi:hypothetical protein